MTDLETACRELLTQWRERGVEEPYGMTWHPPADELEHALEEHTPDAADRLAAQTGEPKEKFEAADKPIPELDELNSEVKHLVEQMEDAT